MITIIEYFTDPLQSRQFAISAEIDLECFPSFVHYYRAAEGHYRGEIRDLIPDIITRQAFKRTLTGQLCAQIPDCDEPKVHENIVVSWHVDETPWWTRPELALPADQILAAH